MNRKELEQQIVETGKERGIVLSAVSIHDRGDYLEFYPTVTNDYAEEWVYQHQIETLIHDLAPVERPHKVGSIDLNYEGRVFSVGDMVELDNVWIRLDAGEEEPKHLIRIGAGCGQYRQGWVKGEVFETPEQNDRALGIKFSRDVFIESPDLSYIGHVTALETAIENNEIQKVEMGQPVYVGHCSWTVRKVKNAKET